MSVFREKDGHQKSGQQVESGAFREKAALLLSVPSSSGSSIAQPGNQAMYGRSSTLF